MKIKNLALLFVLIITISGISGYFLINTNKYNNNYNSKENTKNSYINITSNELNEILKNKDDIFLLDVHTPQQEHIVGTDAFIPYDQIDSNLQNLPKNKNTEIIVYCRSGSMSDYAANKLTELGYTNVKNLLGGKNDWDKLFSANKTEQPQGESHKLSYDFGTIKKEEGPVQTTFQVENHGRAPLIIEDISTSCSCTSADIDKKKLMFNEVATITVTFDPNVHEEPKNKFERYIFLKTNDPQNPEIKFTISVDIEE